MGFNDRYELNKQRVNKIAECINSKDIELVQTGQVQGATWNFFTSPVTGVGCLRLPFYKHYRTPDSAL